MRPFCFKRFVINAEPYTAFRYVILTKEESTATERIFAHAGANAEDISVAVNRAKGLKYDGKKEWDAYEYGLEQRKAGNGENLDLLIDATDYLDRNPDSGIMEVRNNIKENADKKIPYTKSRPSYAKGQEESVWARGISEDGMVYDPSGEIMTWDKTKPRKGQWDMGHVPGQKYSDVHALFSIGALSKREFLEWYRNPSNYRPELPKTNRSHKYE